MAGMFTRNQAKMIAEELYKLIGNDIKGFAKDLAEVEAEEFITVKEAAAMLAISPDRLYRNKDQYGCYTVINKRIKFAKNKLKNAVMNNQVRDLPKKKAKGEARSIAVS